ncbi:hypothetical protein E2C01_042960 [Portunus trituberculatus]|uniref:Uncharacterized protein n=1 Tax=Portunus trituberculatus TaxID=210409 RepID=A0A5B7FUZ7_PORTR|nr:hypothetical protein [Portunus trituberculatus]
MVSGRCGQPSPARLTTVTRATVFTKARKTQRLVTTRVLDGARLGEASSTPLVQLAMHVDDLIGGQGGDGILHNIWCGEAIIVPSHAPLVAIQGRQKVLSAPSRSRQEGRRGEVTYQQEHTAPRRGERGLQVAGEDKGNFHASLE